MTLCVYKVDGKTRLVMPNSQWARDVMAKLEEMGHQIELTGENPTLVQQERSISEMERVDDLLESTGL